VDAGSTLKVLVPEVNNPQYVGSYPLLTISGRFNQEVMTALEIGWRQTLSPSSQLDLALYQHEYRQLRSGQVVGMPPASGGYTNYDIVLGNQTQARTSGAELLLKWVPCYQWSYDVGLAYHRSRFYSPGSGPFGPPFGLDAAGSAPDWSGHISANWLVDTNHRIQATLRHVGRLSDINYRVSLPAYTAADIHYIYRASRQLNWSLGLVNLGSKRVEGMSERRDTALTMVQPMLRAQVKWSY
jgi:outer membrane receptor protein involved in Fe transport